MEKILTISIPTYSQRTKPKPHIVYHISITAPVRSWTVQHRYSDFFTLNQKFLELGLTPPLELPPKSSIFSFTAYNNPQFIETRRQGLEEYLNAILSSKDERYKKLPDWKIFLGISQLKNRGNFENDDSSNLITSPSSSNVSASTSPNLRGNKPHSFFYNGNSSNNSTEFNRSGASSNSSLDIQSTGQWLEECRNLQIVINEIRTCIAARNKFVSRNETSAACEAIVLARKKHNILCQRYSALKRELHHQLDDYYENIQQKNEINEGIMESGQSIFSSVLTSSASNNNKSRKNKVLLSKGELSRRQDLLENIRTEKEQLEKLLGNIKSSDNFSSSYNQSFSNSRSVGSSSTIENSFSSSNSGINRSSSKSKTRRKFGITVSQEVEERTRGLDNTQILQLQKDMLQDQDKALEQFSTILHRQREIGQTINNELDLQNQLLDDLDHNVNKVEYGLGNAEKRMKKVLGNKKK